MKDTNQLCHADRLTVIIKCRFTCLSPSYRCSTSNMADKSKIPIKCLSSGIKLLAD